MTSPQKIQPITATSHLDTPVTLTEFPSQFAQSKTEHSWSLRRLASEIKRRKAHDKEALPWFKLASFGNERSPKGRSLRNNANVLSVTGVEADYDGGKIALDESTSILTAHGVAALVYSTPSSEPDKPRWRVFAPFSTPMLPAERTRFMERLNGLFDGTLDGASFTLSQSYFGGNVAGKPPIETRLVDGLPIDLIDVLDITALPKGRIRTADREIGAVDTTGSGKLISLASKVCREGSTTIDDLKTALLDPKNAAAAAHVAKEQNAKTGGAERAIERAWKNATRPPDANEIFDDPDAEAPENDNQLDADADDPAPPPRLRFLSIDSAAGEPKRRYLVKGFLAEGDVACIYGQPGAGKSLIAPYLAHCIATGRRAFDLRTRQGTVWYCSAEDAHGMRGRTGALAKRYGTAPGFRLVEGVSDMLTKDSQEWRELRNATDAKRPALIVIDTLAAANPGLIENSSEDMSRVVSRARRLARGGTCVVLVHHSPKTGDTPRGHSVLNGALDVGLQLEPKDADGIVRGRLSKNRNGSVDKEFAFKIEVEEMGVDEDGDSITFALAAEISGPVPFKRKALTGASAAALEIAKETMGDDRSMLFRDWQDACVASNRLASTDNRQTHLSAFGRARAALLKSGHIVERGDRAFVAAWAAGAAHLAYAGSIDDDADEDLIG